MRSKSHQDKNKNVVIEPPALGKSEWHVQDEQRQNKNGGVCAGNYQDRADRDSRQIPLVEATRWPFIAPGERFRQGHRASGLFC